MFELRAHDGGLTAHSSAFDQDGTPFYIKGVTWRGMEGGEDRRGAELTRTVRPAASVGYVRATRTSLPRWVRTGRRAACPQGPAYCTYWVRVPASAVPYVPRTVAPQALRLIGPLLALGRFLPPRLQWRLFSRMWVGAILYLERAVGHGSTGGSRRRR